jgi:hypothetical protein
MQKKSLSDTRSIQCKWKKGMKYSQVKLTINRSFINNTLSQILLPLEKQYMKAITSFNLLGTVIFGFHKRRKHKSDQGRKESHIEELNYP